MGDAHEHRGTVRTPGPARRACITQVDCVTPRVSGTQRCASRYSPTIPTCLTGSSGSSGRGRGQRVTVRPAWLGLPGESSTHAPERAWCLSSRAVAAATSKGSSSSHSPNVPSSCAPPREARRARIFRAASVSRKWLSRRHAARCTLGFADLGRCPDRGGHWTHGLELDRPTPGAAGRALAAAAAPRGGAGRGCLALTPRSARRFPAQRDQPPGPRPGSRARLGLDAGGEGEGFGRDVCGGRGPPRRVPRGRAAAGQASVAARRAAAVQKATPPPLPCRAGVCSC